MFELLAAAAAWTAPLTVATTPDTAEVVAFYLDGREVRRTSCWAPCTLQLPQGAPFRLVVVKPGWKAGALPAVSWAPTLTRGAVLKPDHVSLTMTKED